MFDKNVKIVTVDKDKVEKINSTFRTNLLQITLIMLFSICIALYFILGNFVIVPKVNIIQADIDMLHEYINEDKAEMVYNYIQENGLTDYNELENINGVSFKTIEKLEKYTYIKEVD